MGCAIDGCRVALGPCLILHYVLQVGWAGRAVGPLGCRWGSEVCLCEPAARGPRRAPPPLQGLWHPARKVRQVYWKLYNNLYIGAQVRGPRRGARCGGWACSAVRTSQPGAPSLPPSLTRALPPQDALVACYPGLMDEEASGGGGNSYARHELDMVI